MFFVTGLKNRLKKVYYGSDTFAEFLLGYVDRITNSYLYAHKKRSRFIEGEHYRFKDVRFPLLNDATEEFFFRYIFLDTFYSYMYRNDRYDEENYDYCDRFIPEGLYGLVNDKVNVEVKTEDIVIDAGSWVGDFAAYAAGARKATVYAFEPSDSMFAELQKTASLNAGIIPVKKALGNAGQKAEEVADVVQDNSGESFDITTIDDFVKENNLSTVDFIKSDIEGNERHMLAGAQETLARFAPKLALCTYHLPDDPEVMAKLILHANPKYNIVQKRKKLFASVPE